MRWLWRMRLKRPVGFSKYWKSQYAMTNVNEYWAMGVQEWFEYLWLAYEGKPLYHDAILRRDPLLYALLDEWLPRIDWIEVE